jgi:signal transduction histidine kinase
MAKPGQVPMSHKLTRMNLLVSATALLMACAAFVTYDLLTFRQIIVRNTSVQAQLLGSNSVAALTFGDVASAENTLAALRLAPSVVAACVYSRDGKPFATYRRDAAGAIPLAADLARDVQERQWFSAGRAMLIHRIVFQGGTAGFIFIESDLQSLTDRLQRYLLISTIVLLASLVVAAAASATFRREIVQPIAALAEVARQVSQEGVYSARAAADGAPAELSVLVGAFNQMLTQIEQRDRQLQGARDELEDRVAQRTAELAAANKELESFSYSVSHDLRAPLRSIDGFSVALLEDYGDKFDAEGRGHFERIRAATRRMGVLIDDMLELARVTRAEMQRERVDLSAIARAVEADIRKSDGARKVECVIGDGIEAVGDVRLLRVVMDNLLRNAWKYTSKHPSARIEFGQICDQPCNNPWNGGHKPVFFVKDDGAGFDPAYAGKLFGAFQRLHGAADFPGTGVGLATVQRILQRHGGRVWAESQVEKGATFFFMV